MSVVTKMEFWSTLLRDLGVKRLPKLDILLHAVVLHTHVITLRSGFLLDDAGGSTTLAPLTRNGVGDVLASLWPASQERGRQSYWFFAYCAETPYESVKDVPESLVQRLDSVRDAFLRHPLVEALEEDA